MNRACTVLFLISLLPATASWGLELPELRLTTLAGTPFALPTDALARVTVLVVGFSERAGKESGPWVRRLDEDVASGPRISVYSVAVLAGVPFLFRSLAQGIIERGTPREQRSTFLISFTDEAAWKRIVGFVGRDDSYLLVLDARGRVAMRLHGAFSEGRYRLVAREIARLASADSRRTAAASPDAGTD